MEIIQNNDGKDLHLIKESLYIFRDELHTLILQIKNRNRTMNKCKVSQINSTAVEYSCKITSAIFSTVQKGRQQMKNYKKKLM